MRGEWRVSSGRFEGMPAGIHTCHSLSTAVIPATMPANVHQTHSCSARPHLGGGGVDHGGGAAAHDVRAARRHAHVHAAGHKAGIGAQSVRAGRPEWAAVQAAAMPHSWILVSIVHQPIQLAAAGAPSHRWCTWWLSLMSKQLFTKSSMDVLLCAFSRNRLPAAGQAGKAAERRAVSSWCTPCRCSQVISLQQGLVTVCSKRNIAAAACCHKQPRWQLQRLTMLQLAHALAKQRLAGSHQVIGGEGARALLQPLQPAGQ